MHPPVVQGSVSAQLAPGAATIPFSGKLRGKSLPPGAYVATVVAKDAAGNASAVSTAGFTRRRLATVATAPVLLAVGGGVPASKAEAVGFEVTICWGRGVARIDSRIRHCPHPAGVKVGCAAEGVLAGIDAPALAVRGSRAGAKPVRQGWVRSL